jgi:hypothetical protein
MQWDQQKVLLNVRQADTDDLLDRITAYRPIMEPDAVQIIERELHQRGVTARQIAEHGESCQRECVFHADGSAKMCSLCRKPAVCEAWAWHKLFGKLPLFPRRLRFCKQHGAPALPDVQARK